MGLALNCTPNFQTDCTPYLRTLHPSRATRAVREVDGMTSHYVVALTLSRLCSFAFWFYGYKELRRGPGPNIAGGLLIMCHFVRSVGIHKKGTIPKELQIRSLKAFPGLSI